MTDSTASGDDLPPENGNASENEPRQPAPQQQVVHVTQQVSARPPSNGLGSAAGVLGIVGLVLIWVPFLGGILTFLALIFGIISTIKGRQENLPIGMAVTGIATGAVGVLLYVLVTFIFVVSGLAETMG